MAADSSTSKCPPPWRPRQRRVGDSTLQPARGMAELWGIKAGPHETLQQGRRVSASHVLLKDFAPTYADLPVQSRSCPVTCCLPNPTRITLGWVFVSPDQPPDFGAGSPRPENWKLPLNSAYH